LTFATAFLVPYRFWAERGDFHLPGGPLYIGAGILAGWSNENLGMLAILMALGVCIYRFRTLRRMPLWAMAGLAGAIFGWGMLMSAPGNALRLVQLGGASAIPLFSATAFNRFFIFWCSQQLELALYFLASLCIVWRLRSTGRLSWRICMPGCIFHYVAGQPRALHIEPLHTVPGNDGNIFLRCAQFFAFLAVLGSSEKVARFGYTLFCCLVAASVIEQMLVFVEARPVTEAKIHALRAGKSSIRLYEYPGTNKYFFPGYDIREINMYNLEWQNQVPWREAQALTVEGILGVSAIVSNNIIYLDNLPSGGGSIACITHEPTVESFLRKCTRTLFLPIASATGKKRA